MNDSQASPGEQSTIELVAFLFQIARSHQHRSLESLLGEAKEIYPDVTDDQWDRATVELAHTLHKNDYMGFATDYRLQGKPRHKASNTSDGPST